MNIPVLSNAEARVRFQRGLSLIELMISITLGLIILASLSTLFVNQTKTRVELDKSNRMIDNGRYAMDLLVGEVQLAGYFGEYVPPLSTCSAVPVGIWGMDTGTAAAISPSPYTAIPTASLSAGSDMLAIRRVSTGTPTAQAAAVAGVQYMQVSLCEFDTRGYVISTVPADFTLRKKNCTQTSTTPYADLRRLQEHVYFISPNNASGDSIPTLKRLETDQSTGVLGITPLAEGIEYMQIEYGIDNNSSFQMTATTTAGSLVLTELNADPIFKRVKQGMGVYDATSDPNKKIPDGYTVGSMTSAVPSPPTPGTITTIKAAGAGPIVAGTAVPLTIPYLSATITPNSALLTNVSSDPKLSLVSEGNEICGVGIPAGTFIADMTTTTITLSRNATTCSATNPTAACPTMPLNIPAITISPQPIAGDGVADVWTASPSATQWLNVVAVRISLLARNTEQTKGYTDTKTYTLGKDSAGNDQTVGPFNDHYKRHVFTQFIRLINTAGRREIP